MLTWGGEGERRGKGGVGRVVGKRGRGDEGGPIVTLVTCMEG